MGSLIILFLRKNWFNIVFALVLGMTITLAYYRVKNIGYKEAEVRYNEVIAKQQELLDKRIFAIEKLSTDLVDKSDESTKTLVARMDKVMLAVKNKPLYTVIDGKCTPSQDFLDSYNSLIIEGNSK